MRHILKKRLPAALRLMLLPLLGGALFLARPAPTFADPVNDLRLALNADQKELVNPPPEVVDYRRANLQRKVDNLRTIADLWGALSLKDWKDDLFKVSVKIRVADSNARREVGVRLTKAIDDVIAHGDPNNRLAAANSIGEKGPTIRSLSTAAGDQVVMGDAGGFVRTLTPQVMRLAEDKNLGVRQEALRALGNIFPNARQVVPVFKHVLETDAPGPKRLAADGLGQLIRVVNHLHKQTGASSGVEAYNPDVLDAVVSVLGANAVGLADDDVQVRVLSLQNIKEAAEAVSELIREPQKEIGNLTLSKDFPPQDRPVTPLEKKLIMGNHEEIAREINDLMPAIKAMRAARGAGAEHQGHGWARAAGCRGGAGIHRHGSLPA